MSLCEFMMGPQVHLAPSLLAFTAVIPDTRAFTAVVPDERAFSAVVPDTRAYASADPEPSVVRAHQALRIRPVRRADHESWAALRQALWPDVDATELHLAIERWWWIADHDRQCLVAEENRRLVGFIELSVRTSAVGCETNRVAFVEGWYVAPDVRRRGIGRALLNAAESWGRTRGCSALGLDSAIGAGSEGVRFGFTEVARVVSYRKAIG